MGSGWILDAVIVADDSNDNNDKDIFIVVYIGNVQLLGGYYTYDWWLVKDRISIGWGILKIIEDKAATDAVVIGRIFVYWREGGGIVL